MNTSTDEPAVHETLARVDAAWAEFRERVRLLPSEQLELRLGEGAWTRKQMLAHIGAWHELTAERLARLMESGEAGDLAEQEDVLNARTARASAGRTSGEVLFAMDESYRHLRREISRLSDGQLAAHDDWAAAIIAGNTNRHYVDHLDDLESGRSA
jgi:hypothetical protein